MEELSKNVLEKVDELVEIIKNSDEYKKYIEIKNKLEKNEGIKEKIELIKKTQQEIVKCEYHKDYEKMNILEKSLSNMKKELDSIPIYNEYKNVIDDLNENLSQIKKLEDYLQNITK